MKKTTLRIWRPALASLLLVGSACLAAAQNPPPANAPANSPATAPPATAPGADPAPLPTADQASYLFGLVFGSQIRSTGAGDVVMDSVIRGLKDGLQGKQPTPADQQQIRAYLRSAADATLARNQQAAKDFLAHNAHEKGVVTTASGLQYKIISAGNAKAAPIAATDKVTVDYRGKLIDGTEFDSSYSRGMPATFPVTGVIKGWQEALVLMKPGAKWQLFIPPELAYGPRSQAKIPAGSLLIFEINVLSAESSAAPAAAAPRPAPGVPRTAAPQTPVATPQTLDK